MPELLKYEDVQDLRDLMLEELLNEPNILALTVDHMRLVEARIQTLILLDISDKTSIKKAIKARKDAQN